MQRSGRPNMSFILCNEALLTYCRPMGGVAGLVNKPNQSAKEIVDEIVSEAAELLGSANQFVSPKSKL